MLVFLGAVAVVYVTATTLLLMGLWRRIRRRPAPARSRGKRWLRRAVVGLAVVGLGCMAYARFVEPRWLDVTRVQLKSPKLPPGAGPIRIVHISDLHCEAAPGLEEDLPDIIAELRPDAIVFTGDAVNSPDGLANFRRCMERLAKIAPTFAVRGNWEVRFFPELDFLGGTGVAELDGAAVTLEVKGARLRIAGAPFGRLARGFPGPPPRSREAFTVLLYHVPGAILDVASEGVVDLYLAGHTHGGQVALPFYGALVTLARHGKRFEAGLYREGETWLYVNRGIGMEGAMMAPRVRFLARPEVTVIDLSSGS